MIVYLPKRIFISRYERYLISYLCNNKVPEELLEYHLLYNATILIHGSYSEYKRRLNSKLGFSKSVLELVELLPNGLSIINTLAISISYRIRQHLLSRGILGKYDEVLLNQDNEYCIIVNVLDDKPF